MELVEIQPAIFPINFFVLAYCVVLPFVCAACIVYIVATIKRSSVKNAKSNVKLSKFGAVLAVFKLSAIIGLALGAIADIVISIFLFYICDFGVGYCSFPKSPITITKDECLRSLELSRKIGYSSGLKCDSAS